MSKSGKIIIILAVVFLIGVIVFFFQRKDRVSKVLEVTQNPIEIPTTNSVPTTDVQNPLLVGILGDHKDDLISFSILPDSKVNGEVFYLGRIKGGYFFEGKLLINILDSNKKLVKASYAISKGDWETDRAVDFEGTIDFTNLPIGPAYFEIHNDNASDLREKDKSILVPISIEKFQDPTTKVDTVNPKTITFLKSFVKQNQYADIKECKKDGKKLFATYPDTGVTHSPTTFYDDSGEKIETCGGFGRETPDPETSLCKTLLSYCGSIYYKSLNKEINPNVDTYHLN